MTRCPYRFKIAVVAVLAMLAGVAIAGQNSAFAQTLEDTNMIKIALLADYGHTEVFDYAVQQFNYEQQQIGTDYTIVPRTAEITKDTDVASLIDGLSDEGYTYFVGPFFSSNAQKAAEYADMQDDTVVISPSSTAPALSKVDSLFRLVPTDVSQGSEIVEHLKSQGKEYIVVLYRDDVWGNGLLDAVESEYESNIKYKIALNEDHEQVNHAAVASDVGAKVGELVESYGADRVAVLLITFNDNAINLIRSTMADSQLSDVLGSVNWYGTDGVANSDKFIADPAIGEFLASVKFTATLFTVEPNPTNRDIASQPFVGDSTYRDGLYDAVFLLADTVIVNDEEKEHNPESTVRSLVLDVAGGLKGHDHHHSTRAVGDGALGTYTLDQYGDMNAPLTYAKYSVFEKPGGSFEWEQVNNIMIGLLTSYEHTGVFKYAVDIFNQEQHILGSGYQISPVIVPVTSQNVAGHLQSMTADGYTYFVGPLASDVAKHAVSFADMQGDTVLISPSSTAASLAIAGDSLFRLVPDDDKQAPEISSLLQSEGKEHIIIIYRDDEWGHGLLNSIEREYPHQIELKISLGDPSTMQAASHADVARAVAQKAEQVIADNPARQVAIVMISFDAETVSMVRAVLADEAASNVLGGVKWYGTDGAALQSELVENRDVAQFLSSVEFTATKFAVEQNPINRIIASQTFEDDTTFGDNVYDAVFLLADTAIVNDEEKAQNPDSTVRSLVLDVAGGLKGHDHHHSSRTVGDGALGEYTLNAAGDMASPLNFPQYSIYESGDGSFEWRAVAASVAKVCR